MMSISPRTSRHLERDDAFVARVSLVKTALLMSLLLSGCVVSTHAGVGSPPVIPEAPGKKDEAPITAQKPGPVQIGAAHFLISYRGAMRAAPYIDRTKEEAQALASELRNRVLSGEEFEKIAAEHSDDRGSAAQGGELGTFRREQMVPEFSEAAFALEIGEISDIVESPFGYHVILRTE